MTTYPSTHLLNPLFRYANAHETQQPGYLALRFARIVAEREASKQPKPDNANDH